MSLANTTTPHQMSTVTTSQPLEWANWARNQTCSPVQIFNPTTVGELRDIVRKAQKTGQKIRCAASGHSWSSTSVTDGYLVIVNNMKMISEPVRSETDGSWTVQLETGVMVKDLDDYLRAHSPPLALPSNVVLDSVRYGGILSLGCHGAATLTRTLPDLISEVTIIDAHGNLNIFTQETDAQEFSTACVNLGLLGIIYSYTLKVEPMFQLKMTDTYPLLSDFFASPKLSGPKLKAMVQGNDQTEILYWPFNSAGLDTSTDHIWVKQWKRTDQDVSISNEKEAFLKLMQEYETKFGNHLYEFMAAHPSSTPFVNCLLFKAIGGKNTEVVLAAPDTIHYQAGIDNLPCVDLEMALKVNNDFSNVVNAWNYVIAQLYEYAKRGKFPFNLALEMRFVKASTVLMSNAYDEDPNATYCMIEVLSVNNTEGFDEFSSTIAQFWMYNFQAKPHWAKMWEHVPGIVPYLRQQAGERYDRFEAIRRRYDPNGMFMNSTFAGVLGHKKVEDLK